MRPGRIVVFDNSIPLPSGDSRSPAGLGAAAARSPGKIASVDPYGTSTFADMAERTTAMASGIAASGFTKDCKFGVLARNHSAMVECMVAASKLGADLVLLNTGLAARSIEEIIKQHTVDALFVDDDFEPQVRYQPAEIPRISTHPNSVVPQRRSIEHLISAGARTKSGGAAETTGKASGTHLGYYWHTQGCTPPQPPGFGAIAAMLSRMPLRATK